MFVRTSGFDSLQICSSNINMMQWKSPLLNPNTLRVRGTGHRRTWLGKGKLYFVCAWRCSVEFYLMHATCQSFVNLKYNIIVVFG